MIGYQIIGLTMGETPFIHKDKVYTEWADVVKEIFEIIADYNNAIIDEHDPMSESPVPVTMTLKAIDDEKFWLGDHTFYKVHTVEIILPNPLTHSS